MNHNHCTSNKGIILFVDALPSFSVRDGMSYIHLAESYCEINWKFKEKIYIPTDTVYIYAHIISRRYKIDGFK